MKKRLLLLFLMLIFVLVASSASAVINCCIPPHIESELSIQVGYVDPVTQLEELIFSQEDCDQLSSGVFLYHADCYDESGATPELRGNVIETACCCTDSGIPELFGASISSEEDAISRLFCEDRGYTPVTLEAAGFTNCVQACADFASGTGEEIVYIDEYYNVKGRVYKNVSGVVTPLEGAIVASLADPYHDTYSDANGFYDLGQTPGAASGINKFQAGTDTTHPYTCELADLEYVLTQDTELDFTLTCQENTNACTPNWEYGEWSTVCYPINGIFYQVRTAKDVGGNDGTGCGGTDGLLPLRRTEDEDGNPLCTQGGVIIGDCGDGKLEVGGTEQCDGDLFIDPSSATGAIHNASSDGNPQCAEWFEFSSGEITCTSKCGYDYSQCQSGCDLTRCRHVSQCGVCAACDGNIVICGSECEHTRPRFMPAWFDNPNFATSRNVFDLYTASIDETIPAPLRYEEGTDSVTVEWTYSSTCESEIYGYRVEICEESGMTNACVQNSKRTFLSSGSQDYDMVISGLEPNTNYCYNVCALRTDGTSICTVEAGEEYPCFATGEQYCMQDTHDPGLNCIYDEEAGKAIPSGCDYESFGSNAYQYTNLSFEDVEVMRELCAGELLCVETPVSEFSRGAECKAVGQCAQCNGLFGLYGNAALNPNGFNCEAQQYSFLDDPDTVPNNRNEFGRCYKDETKTPFMQFKTCEAVASCYDYKSQGACENDPCFKFVQEGQTGDFVQGCQWQAYTTPQPDGTPAAELGIGVCSPVEVEAQDCTRCDTNSSLGFCDEQMCGLYGDCYYKEDATHELTPSVFLETFYFNVRDEQGVREDHLPSCLPERDMSCFMYDTQEDCEGGVTPVLNVLYDEEGNRIAGNNAVITTSNDTFSFGLCVWNNNFIPGDNQAYGCNKDADGSHQAPTPEYLDDCYANNEESQDCYQDLTPPNTSFYLRDGDPQFNNLPTYGQQEIIDVEYSVEDDVWDPIDIKTYIALSSLSCSAYGCDPQEDYSEMAVAQECSAYGCPVYPIYELGDFDFSTIESGAYTFMYYSQDAGGNLEEVNYHDIYIDAQPPTINEPTVTYDTIQATEDVFQTDVTITFTTSEETYCEGTLQLLIDPTREYLSGDIMQEGISFEAFYFALPDGQYDFTIVCSDKYGNQASYVQEVNVEGDASITNPQPRRGDMYSSASEVDLSVQTNRSATCKFSSRQEAFANMPAQNEFTSSMGGTVHTFDFEDYEPGSGSNEYIFYVSCLFDDGEVTQQQDGDIISFAIDNMAPYTTVYSTYEGDWVEFTGAADYVKNRAIRIVCNDSNALTPQYNWGCDRIYYCIGDFTDIDAFDPLDHCDGGAFRMFNSFTGDYYPDGSLYGDLEFNFREHAKKQLYYFSEDTAGHQGDLESISLKIIDTYFREPDFTVSRLRN